ncbi:MAG: hypothetical protein GX303_03550 [Clostridiales bacterium]|nr:hypothetical protein [Clostridiales bacterium]
MTNNNSTKTRTITKEKVKGLSVSDCILIGVLLAAGVVLKQVAGSFFNLGMKPNFIIAMYCLCILLIKPRVVDALIIGLLAGAVSQFNPGTPYINFASELAGALSMALIIRIPLKFKFKSKSLNLSVIIPAVATLISTLISGFVFLGILYIALYAGALVNPIPVQAFLPIIFGTAFINAIIVQLLYMPIKLTLKRSR